MPKTTAAPAYEEGRWASAFAPRAPGEKRYWLLKSEPSTFSFDDLWKAPKRTTFWDGIRNHAARNFLRDGMKKGDLAFFYHSSTDPQSIVGIVEIVKEGYPDTSALDPSHASYDAKSTAENPTWYMVDVRAVAPLEKPVTLAEIKKRPELKEMALVRIGRLSVTPVTPEEWKTIMEMSETSL
jgi:predicted RNA-binding protein with PUA-like domain